MPEFRVALPMVREQIEEAAWSARAACGLAPFDRAPMARILEFVLPELIPTFELRVIETQKLGQAEAITDASRPIITFGAATYTGLCKDQARSRMTAAHELGHLLLHTGQTGFAFLKKRHPSFDPERQADIFAAAFLMPECAFRRMKSIREAMRTFGVSKDAATCRARNLRMWEIIGGKSKRPPSKKKGYDKRRTP